MSGSVAGSATLQKPLTTQFPDRWNKRSRWRTDGPMVSPVLPKLMMCSGFLEWKMQHGHTLAKKGRGCHCRPMSAAGKAERNNTPWFLSGELEQLYGSFEPARFLCFYLKHTEQIALFKSELAFLLPYYSETRRDLQPVESCPFKVSDTRWSPTKNIITSDLSSQTKQWTHKKVIVRHLWFWQFLECWLLFFSKNDFGIFNNKMKKMSSFLISITENCCCWESFIF